MQRARRPQAATPRPTHEELAKKLPISNRYVFARVMRDNPDLCRELIERVIGEEVGRIEIVEAESEITSIERRSVCIDVFAESGEAAFTVEMQAYDEEELPLRIRYYRSLIDRRLLRKGCGYADLKPVYIVFICTRDPFGLGLPVYTFRNACEEDARAAFDDRCVNMVLNAAGDLGRARPEVAGLLQYISTGDPAQDALSRRLQGAVDEAYDDERWVGNVITLEQDIANMKRIVERKASAEARERGLAEGRAEGMAQGRAEGMAQGKAEGKAEGILGAVAMLRGLGQSDGDIEALIMKQFGLSQEDAATYAAARA